MEVQQSMINFAKYRNIFIIISSVTVAISLICLITWGLQPSIDFTGGSVVELQGSDINQADGQTVLSDDDRNTIETVFNSQGLSIRSFLMTSEDSVEIRTSEFSQETLDSVTSLLQETFEDLEVINFETVGPSVGQEQLQDTFTAVVLTVIVLLIYIAWRFNNRRFGVTAIAALIHDVLVILGVFAILGKFFGVEVDIMFVTATLTALTFSVHDTIVLYDRVREVRRRNPKEDLETVVNLAINQILVRSLSTSLSLIFVLIALILLGGESIRWFVVALLVGTISGAYSSPFTAAPLLMMWNEKRPQGSNKKS